VGVYAMLYINEKNKVLFDRFVQILSARGMDNVSPVGSIGEIPITSKAIYLTDVEIDFAVENNQSLLSELRARKVIKAIFIKFSTPRFLVNEYLNGSVIEVEVPICKTSNQILTEYYLNYILEFIIEKLPNLPCGVKSHDTIGLIKKLGTSDVTVLINGPTGTGKEVASNLIHNFSKRRDAPFLAVNCAAIPDQMLESTLFGHEKGSFTGAMQSNSGLIRAANNGTLLLDEISEMPLALQSKLLRFVQEKKVMPIGGTKEHEVNVRILATTNRNMYDEVKAGNFREDLFYRLNVFPLNTLALNQRIWDIPAIVAHFLFNLDKSNTEKTEISNGTFELLMEHDWPGNVRELFNVIQRAMLLCSSGIIKGQDLVFDDSSNSKILNTAEALAAKFKDQKINEVQV
jgi:two-component system response regulator FlrC